MRFGSHLSLLAALCNCWFPESQYAGKFDLGGSRSISHILVICAAVIQLMGYLDAFGYAQTDLTCPAL